MDFVDKSDVEVFTMKLTLVMYRRENSFSAVREISVLKLVVLYNITVMI